MQAGSGAAGPGTGAAMDGPSSSSTTSSHSQVEPVQNGNSSTAWPPLTAQSFTAQDHVSATAGDAAAAMAAAHLTTLPAGGLGSATSAGSGTQQQVQGGAVSERSRAQHQASVKKALLSISDNKVVPLNQLNHLLSSKNGTGAGAGAGTVRSTALSSQDMANNPMFNSAGESTLKKVRWGKAPAFPLTHAMSLQLAIANL